MLVREIMSTDVMTCAPSTSLREVAQKMVESDCGAIPVTEGGKVIGVVTDRDIVCRAVALGKNPMELKAQDCMTTKCVTIRPDASVEECCDLLEKNKIRRLPVVDDNDNCCGMVAQADIALCAEAHETAELLREVSKQS
jgi:CBS domain-containing protein